MLFFEKLISEGVEGVILPEGFEAFAKFLNSGKTYFNFLKLIYYAVSFNQFKIFTLFFV